MTVQEIGDKFTLLSHQGKAQATVMHVSGEAIKNITGIELICDDIALIISEKTDPELKDKLLDLKANCDLAIEGRDVKLKELEETLAQTIENDEVAYETLKLHDQEEIGMLNSKIVDLEEQIEKMKNCFNCKKRSGTPCYKKCEWEWNKGVRN